MSELKKISKEELKETLAEHKIWVKSNKKKGKKANLSEANLFGANLTRANLIGANLAGANLAGANLTRANLAGANLTRANLNGANLREANLREADLSEANLREADLREANLSEANLIGANLSEANLRFANLSEANLIGANLSEANLIGANLSEANLRGANISGAKSFQTIFEIKVVKMEWPIIAVNGLFFIGCESGTYGEWEEKGLELAKEESIRDKTVEVCRKHFDNIKKTWEDEKGEKNMSKEANFDKCPTCKEFDWLGEHKCPPVFYFKHDDLGDEFEEIRAHSFENAAEKFAVLYNEDGECALMGNTESVIISDGKIEKTFNVSAEPDIHYSVTEI